MKTYTVDDIVALKPCYTRERIEALWGNRHSLSLIEIMALDIPHGHRFWIYCRLNIDPTYFFDWGYGLREWWVEGTLQREERRYDTL